MELDAILERLRAITGQKNNRAMCVYIGIRDNAYGDWKKRNSIPWEACYLAAKKTGYTMEWILSGEGVQKHTEAPKAEIDEDKLIKDFAQVVVDGVQLRFLRTTDDTTEETLEILGRKLYSLYTGEISIPKSKNYKKAV
jgi:hypothetical protein